MLIQPHEEHELAITYASPVPPPPPFQPVSSHARGVNGFVSVTWVSGLQSGAHWAGSYCAAASWKDLVLKKHRITDKIRIKWKFLGNLDTSM